MRSLALLAALLLPTPALAQAQQPGTTSGAVPPSRLPPTTTAAPVPDSVPSIGGAAVVPEQVARPGNTAGPADATPFSSTPSGQLPSDMSLPVGRGQPGGAGNGTPNLSR